MRPSADTHPAHLRKRCWEWTKWHGGTAAVLFASRLDPTWLFSAKPWDLNRLYYHVLNTPCLCDESAVGKAICAAFQTWAPHCGITFQGCDQRLWLAVLS